MARINHIERILEAAPARHKAGAVSPAKRALVGILILIAVLLAFFLIGCKAWPKEPPVPRYRTLFEPPLQCLTCGNKVIRQMPASADFPYGGWKCANNHPGQFPPPHEGENK